MIDYLNEILTNSQSVPIIGYALVFALVFFESFAFIGLIVPGSIALILAGFLVAQGVFDATILFFVASIGAILGDSFSFYLGEKNKIIFSEKNKIFKTSLLDKGKKYFRQHGGKSVFLGRFIGWIRPIVPFVAGIFHLDYKKFILWNILSGILWAGVHIAIGYFFGYAWQAVVTWLDRIGIFIGVVAVFVVFFWLLKRFFVKNGVFILNIIKSLWNSFANAIKSNEYIKKLVVKYPRFFVFVQRRLNRKTFYGLPLTFLFIAFIYVLILLGGAVEDFITSDMIVFVDVRVSNLFADLRTPGLTSFLLWVTLLGKSKTIIVFAVTSTILLGLWNKKGYILPLWCTVIGSAIFVKIGKLAFHRARPDLVVYTEHSYSFPSGHSAIAIAFYGFITYVIIRSVTTWKMKVTTFFVGLFVILFIGFSRIYLGVHYVSDVWSGYLVGALWLIIGISLSEWLIIVCKKFVPSIKAYVLSITFILIAVSFYIYTGLNYHPINLVKKVDQTKKVAQEIKNIFTTQQLKYSESLIGQKQEPISFVIIANDDMQLKNALRQAGWFEADKVYISTVSKTIFYAIEKKQYLTAPMTPSFWNGKPHDFGFEKPTNEDNVRKRHHVRIWKTNSVTKNGKNIYAGTVSLDNGTKWGITHTISPDIDTERNMLMNDLEQTKMLQNFYTVQSIKPEIGENFSGEQFFTDGKQYIIFIK